MLQPKFFLSFFLSFAAKSHDPWRKGVESISGLKELFHGAIVLDSFVGGFR